MTFEWVPGVAVAIVTGAISFWASTRSSLDVINVKMMGLKDGETLMAAELRAATQELRQATSDIRALSVEQSIVNKVVNDALSSIVMKLDQHSETIAAHTTAISVLNTQASDVWRAKAQ